MKTFWLQVLAGVCVAALTANVICLWKFNERLTRIETVLTVNHQLAIK